MDRDTDCSREAGGDIKPLGEKAAAASSAPRFVPGAGRVLRERVCSRSKTAVCSPAQNSSGRVLRDRTSRRTTAWKNCEKNSKASGQVNSAVAKTRRKPEHPQRRRNAGTRSEATGITGDYSGLPMDSEDKKDPLDKDAPASRPRRPQAAIIRLPRPSGTLVCKSEPESEPAYRVTDSVVDRTCNSEDDEHDEEDDCVLIVEEDPPFRDDPVDLNYKPEGERKSRELSEEERMQVILKHGQGKGYKTISKELCVPVTTIANIIRKFKVHGTVANLPGRGRKRKIDPRLNRRIVRMVEKEPRKTPKQIQADLQDQGTTVSSRTIRRCLNESGLQSKRPRRTPLKHRGKKAQL